MTNSYYDENGVFDIDRARQKITESEERREREEERAYERAEQERLALANGTFRLRPKPIQRPRKKWQPLTRDQLLDSQLEKFGARQERILEKFGIASGRIMSMSKLIVEAQGGYQPGTLFLQTKQCSEPPCPSCPHLQWRVWATPKQTRSGEMRPDHPTIKQPRSTRAYKMHAHLIADHMTDILELIDYRAELLKRMRYADQLKFPRCRVLDAYQSENPD